MGNQQPGRSTPVNTHSTVGAQPTGTKRNTMATDRFGFHANCGTNISLGNDNRSAERLDHIKQFNNGVVLSNRPLKDDELFQVRVEKIFHKWSGSIEIGITTHDPSNFGIPKTMSDAVNDGTQDITIMWDGKYMIRAGVPETEYGQTSFNNIEEGDLLGIMRTSTGELHFYLNGQDQGLARPNIPSKIWAAVDVYGDVIKVSVVDRQNMLYLVRGNPPKQTQNVDVLSFHARCGNFVEILNNNQTARRSTNDFNNGVVMTNRKLKQGEIFEVKIDKQIEKWAGGLEIGVTVARPETLQFPATLTEMTKDVWMMSGASVMKDAKTVKEITHNIDNLDIGESAGVSVQNGDLHFYINGKDLGTFLTKIPGDVYGIADMYGQIAQISVVRSDQTRGSVISQTARGASYGATSTSFDDSALHFHSTCGSNATVFNGNRTAKRDDSQFNYGVVFTHRQLEPEEMVEVEIQGIIGHWSGGIEVGITTIDPTDSRFEFPSTMTCADMGDSWMMSGQSIIKNSNTLLEYYGQQALDDLQEGDKVGLKVLHTGELHFYVNGQDQGVAASGLNDCYYAVIDLYGQTVKVSLTDQYATSRKSTLPAASSWDKPSATLKTLEGINVIIKKGTLTAEKADVIVNSTGRDLNLSAGNIARAILNAAGPAVQKECSKAAPKGVAFGEIVGTSGGKMPCQAIYHGAISGYDNGQGAHTLNTLVANALKKANANRMCSIAFPAIGTGILDYPPQIVAKIMVDEITKFSKANRSTTLKEITIVLYEKDTKTIAGFEQHLMTQAQADPAPPIGKAPQRKQARQHVIALPDTWDDSSNVIVKLTPDSREYLEVLSRFIDCGGPTSVIQIDRIQSANLFFLYSASKKNIEPTIFDQTAFPVERTLYHGTAEDAIDSINRNGFNRSYCGKNATRFGKGVYFALKASYSTTITYSPPNKSGESKVYQTKVLTGQYTQGQGEMIVPPAKDPKNKNVLFNSVVDNMQIPTMFITFHDAHAFPEYLITFKR